MSTRQTDDIKADDTKADDDQADRSADRTDAATTADGGVVRLRPPPPGLSRRNRRQWRSLEVARLERDTVAAARATAGTRTGWQQGFIHSPPRGLGRAGRRAWLGSERAAAREFWRARRASDTDLADRFAGVMVLAITIGIAVLVGVLTRSPDNGPATVAAAAAPLTRLPGSVASTSTSPTSATTPTAAGDSDSGADTAGAVDVAGLPSVAGRWQPAPLTGVAAQTVVTAPAVDPESVVLLPVSAEPVTAADQADPVAAVTAWLARTCGSSWTDPFAADQLRGVPLMTIAGWTATDPRDDPAAAAAWAGVVAARQTRTCGDFQVQTSGGIRAGLSADDGYALVGYTAHRIVTSPDTAPVVEDISGTRLVRQATTDGRWFVDVPAIGG
jgi:hypothetical protein